MRPGHHGHGRPHAPSPSTPRYPAGDSAVDALRRGGYCGQYGKHARGTTDCLYRVGVAGEQERAARQSERDLPGKGHQGSPREQRGNLGISYPRVGEQQRITLSSAGSSPGRTQSAAAHVNRVSDTSQYRWAMPAFVHGSVAWTTSRHPICAPPKPQECLRIIPDTSQPVLTATVVSDVPPMAACQW